MPLRARQEYSIHIGKCQATGGLTQAMLRLAQLEGREIRNTECWALLEREQDAFLDSARKLGVSARNLKPLSAVLRVLAKRLSWREPTVLRVHSGLAVATNAIARLRYLAGPNVPLVLFLHGSTEKQVIESAVLEEHKRCVNSASIVAVPSEAAREFQISMGTLADRIRVVANRIRTQVIQDDWRTTLDIRVDQKVILFCGRLGAEKRPEVVVRAAVRILQSRDDVVLVLAGSGPQDETCLRESASVRNKVRFLGNVADVGGVYSIADILVAPSMNESFGLVPFEAALHNVPLVLSRIRPWTDWLKDSEHCLFVSGSDCAEVADKIESVLCDPEGARDMAARAYEVTEGRFGDSTILEQLQALDGIALNIHE